MSLLTKDYFPSVIAKERFWRFAFVMTCVEAPFLTNPTEFVCKRKTSGDRLALNYSRSGGFQSGPMRAMLSVAQTFAIR